MENKRTVNALDMTEGSIVRLLFLYSLPLLVGNLFQELYNTVDSMIVGNFVGKEAFAAIGCTTMICNTIVRLFNGISVGANVVVSHHYGEKNGIRLHESVETIIVIAVVLGLAVTVAAVPAVPVMLKMISTPAEIYDAAGTYLRIYVFGIVFLLIYNMGASILRGVGDTKRPLRFLIITCIVNIVLDVFFVVFLRTGIAGAAWATVISEALSALLVVMCLMHTHEDYRLTLNDLKVNRQDVSSLFLVGIPAGVQQGLTSFSNAFVQKYINFFDPNVIAGWSAFLKLDPLGVQLAISIGQFASTFIGQNLGAGKKERAIKGVEKAVLLSTIILVLTGLLMFIFAPWLTSLFISDPTVIHYGSFFLRLAAPFGIFRAFNQVYSGALRGAKDAKGPMIINMTGNILIRQAYLFTITRFWNNVYTVGLGYPTGWVACGIMSMIYWKIRFGRKGKADAQFD